MMSHKAGTSAGGNLQATSSWHTHVIILNDTLKTSPTTLRREQVPHSIITGAARTASSPEPNVKNIAGFRQLLRQALLCEPITRRIFLRIRCRAQRAALPNKMRQLQSSASSWNIGDFTTRGVATRSGAGAKLMCFRLYG